ncbi:MAG: hypothetical protein IJ856_01040 [Candidatus Methanomethylophilaceae archaeon]|nr:hypothetical protein [Candidatus Methanomethylophilaceae archaeon]
MGFSEKDFEKRPGKAAVHGIVTFLLLGVLPLLVVMWIDGSLTLPVNIDFISLEHLRSLLMRSVYVSPIMAILSFLAFYYPRSERKHMLLRVLLLFASIGYLLFVTNMGRIGDAVILRIGDMEMTVGITLTLMVGILVGLKMLSIPIIYADYLDCEEAELEHELEKFREERKKERKDRKGKKDGDGKDDIRVKGRYK